jgi:hypothetical protein
MQPPTPACRRVKIGLSEALSPVSCPAIPALVLAIRQLRVCAASTTTNLRGGRSNRSGRATKIKWLIRRPPLPVHAFGNSAFHGRLAWENGHWRHEMHDAAKAGGGTWMAPAIFVKSRSTRTRVTSPTLKRWTIGRRSGAAADIGSIIGGMIGNAIGGAINDALSGLVIKGCGGQ